MVIYVDIDETICFYGADKQYPLAIPNMENIAKINSLFNEGHDITYWTARGAVSGIDWRELTEYQLKSWGCLYHRLRMGDKPAYDLMICDKTKRIEEICPSQYKGL